MFPLEFWDAVHQLEKLIWTKRWDDVKVQAGLQVQLQSEQSLARCDSTGKYVPSPFNGFDLLNHMAVMVTARGKEEAGEAMETLLKEYKEIT